MNEKTVPIYVYLISISLILCLSLFSIYSLSNPNDNLPASDPAPQISVSGEGLIEMNPDVANISFGIKTFGEASEVAQLENARIQENILKALEPFEIPEESLKTVRYYLAPKNRYVYQEVQDERMYSTTEVEGYTLTHTMQLKTSSIEELGAIIDAISAAGANQINSITFELSDPKEAYQAALEKAYDDAYAKANVIKEKSQSKELLIKEVAMDSYNTLPIYREYSFADALASKESTPETSIERGTINVEANVNIVFELVK